MLYRFRRLIELKSREGRQFGGGACDHAALEGFESVEGPA
jgi:hypothetical protein